MRAEGKLRNIYGVSRVMYILEALFEYFISILTTGTFLAKLTTTIGLSDGMTAILLSITGLSGMFQLVSIYLAHKTPVKRWVIPVQLISQLLMAAIYAIPALNLSRYAGAIFFIAIVAANAMRSIIAPVKVNWFMSLVDSKKRGMYSAVLTAVSVVGGTLFTLLASRVIDDYEQRGDMNGAFVIIIITILLLIVLNITPLIISREKYEPAERHPSPFECVSTLFHNRRFKRFLLILTLQAVEVGVCTNFLGTYQIKELGFSMEFIALTNIITNVVWISGLLIFGRLSTKCPYAAILIGSYALTAVSFIFVAISTPSTGAVTFTVYRCINLLASAACTAGQNNLIFEISPPEERTGALATVTIFTGAANFLSTLALTPLVDYLQGRALTLFGIQIFAQQLLALVAFAISLVVLALFARSYKMLSAGGEHSD